LIYIYANNKLARQKRGHNPTLFYDQIIADAEDEVEDKHNEALSSEDDDDVVRHYL